MSERPTLRASRRTVLGKGVSRYRREGLLPAVVFGHGDSIPITVDGHELELLRRRVGPNSLVDMSIDGAAAQPVLVAKIQHHPVTHRPIHVDFHVVNMTEELVVDVPVVAHGLAPAVDKLGGTLVHSIDSVKVRAKADHLPQEIVVDVSGLEDFEGAIHVRDLVVPEGVVILGDPSELVLRILPPRVEAPDEGDEVAEPAAPAAPATPAAPAAASSQG